MMLYAKLPIIKVKMHIGKLCIVLIQITFFVNEIVGHHYNKQSGNLLLKQVEMLIMDCVFDGEIENYYYS